MGAWADQLVGGAAEDTCEWLAYNQSVLGGFDVLIGLQIGLASLKAPSSVSASRLRENLGSVGSLSEGVIAGLLSSSAFPREGDVTSFADPQLGTRTFLALTNDVAGFSAATDAVIEITGFSGNLAQLSIS